MDGAIGILGTVANELALFAALGFLIWGLDDLLVDAIWIGRSAWRRVAVYSRHQRASAADLAGPTASGGLAVFVPAWDESRVIGLMLQHALRAWGEADVTIFVGCYPNDSATVHAVRAVGDPRVRAVVTPEPGPTTKAGCLNALYGAMRAHEEVGIM